MGRSEWALPAADLPSCNQEVFDGFVPPTNNQREKPTGAPQTMAQRYPCATGQNRPLPLIYGADHLLERNAARDTFKLSHEMNRHEFPQGRDL